MSYGISPPRYRLPSHTRLGSLQLQVTNLDRSQHFYQLVLGLDLLSREGSDVSLSPAGEARALVRLHERPIAHPVPRRGLLGLYHFALLLPDRQSLGRFIAHLVQTGVHFSSADHAVSEAIYLWDPDGLGIEVYADRPRDGWRQRGGELYMTTEPLDLEGLVAAVGDEAWSGMPAGTVLGHMHLHVGDLTIAEAFYHAALGFDKTVWNFPGALFMSAGGYHHHLGVNTWAGNTRVSGEDDARLMEWEIVVETRAEMEAAAESCLGAGYDVSGDDGSRVVMAPWNTRLRLRALFESM